MPGETIRSPLVALVFSQGTDPAGAVGRAARALAGGQPVLVSKAVYAARLAVCGQCPAFVAPSTRCRECGCKLKAKLRLATERCPRDQWNQTGPGTP